MAKEKAEKVEAEVNEFLALNESERLEAIIKVRKAFEELDTYPDRIEANARRVKLLELWNKLIHMRGDDLGAADIETGDIQAQSEVEVQQFAESDEQPNEIDIPHSSEILDIADDGDHERGQIISFAEQSDEPHQTSVQSFPELLHPVTVEALSEENALPLRHRSTEDFIGPMPQKHVDPPHDIELERVRLKLTKTGMLHDTVLPAGTIIAVRPVDAHHILESGMADYAAASD